MRCLTVSLVALATVAACASSEIAPPPLTIIDVQRLGIDRGLVPTPGLVTGGQLTEEQIVALTSLGYDTFVSLRPAEEPGAGWEEDFAPGVGANFVRIPIAGAEDVTIANAELLVQTLQGADERGVVVYCRSGNRVGALLALRAHFLDGADPEAALEVGRSAGLTKLEPAVREQLGLEPSLPSGS